MNKTNRLEKWYFFSIKLSLSFALIGGIPAVALEALKMIPKGSAELVLLPVMVLSIPMGLVLCAAIVCMIAGKFWNDIWGDS